MATSKAKSPVRKETKTKTTGKMKKSSAAAEPARTSKAVTLKSAPGEAEIRAKAQEIYTDRLTRGEHGTAENDWLKAEKLLTGKK
jgi:hypothetical protein